jgi:hypothetical protein
VNAIKRTAGWIGERVASLVPAIDHSMPRISRDSRLHLPNPSPIHIVHASQLPNFLGSHDGQTSKLAGDIARRELPASLKQTSVNRNISACLDHHYHTTMPIEVSRMTEADIDGAIDTIQQAFANDPYNNWVFPDRSKVARPCQTRSIIH